MGVLAEYVVQFRAAGVDSIALAAGQVRSALSRVSEAISPTVERLRFMGNVAVEMLKGMAAEIKFTAMQWPIVSGAVDAVNATFQAFRDVGQDVAGVMNQMTARVQNLINHSPVLKSLTDTASNSYARLQTVAQRVIGTLHNAGVAFVQAASKSTVLRHTATAVVGAFELMATVAVQSVSKISSAIAGGLTKTVSGIGKTIGKTVGSFTSALGSVVSPTAILQGMGLGIGMSLAQGLGSGIKSAIGLASQVETLSTSFEVLLGSAGAAKKMMDDINKFAAATPFEQMELADVAKQLLAYGTAADQIIPTMRQLGDIAALSGANLSDLAAIYGKIQSQGRLTAETLEGFQSRGIPITRELAKAFGVTETEVRDLVSEGKIGFTDVQKAIAALTSEGGQFAGGMEKLSQTTAGLWSTVTGNLKTALANVGTAIIDAFNVKPLLQWLGQAMESVAPWAAGMRDYLIFVRENWRLALSIMVERFRIFLLNSWARIKAFAQNVVIAIGWLADNWREVFTDIFNITKTIVTNLFTNLKNLWTAFRTWIKTGRWEFNWKPLTEGFKSAIKQWPAFVEANTIESTEKLDSLMGEWNRRW
jgi:tape measure domain-containing protein